MKKTILFAAAIFLATNALAQGAAQDSGKDLKNNFAAMKPKIIEHLNKEKAIIDEEISCVNGASSGENLRACHEKKKTQMDALRQERHAMREARREERRSKVANDEKSSIK